MKRRVGWLVGATLAFWLIILMLAHRFWKDAVWHDPLVLAGGETTELIIPRADVYSGVAVLLCLLPSVGTLLWSLWAVEQGPAQQLATVLGGTGLRMGFVLLVGLALYAFVPAFQDRPSFWAWVLVFYLLTLALEMGLLLARPAAKDAHSPRSL